MTLTLEDRIVRPADIASRVGQEIGVSEWVTVDQARINAFADCTGDHQFIHVDEEAAKATPFGGTIAHGFLTLSLMSKMGGDVSLILDGIVMGINYGFDKVRFLQPVRAGKRVRGRFVLQEAAPKDDKRWLLRYAVTVEIEGEEKPALVAEWLTMQVLG